MKLSWGNLCWKGIGCNVLCCLLSQELKGGVGELFWTRVVWQKVHYLSGSSWKGIEVITAQCCLATRHMYLHQGEEGHVSSFETEYCSILIRLVRGKSRQKDIVRQKDNLRHECLGDGNERRRPVTLPRWQVELYQIYFPIWRNMFCNLDKYSFIMLTRVEI